MVPGEQTGRSRVRESMFEILYLSRKCLTWSVLGKESAGILGCSALCAVGLYVVPKTCSFTIHPEC